MKKPMAAGQSGIGQDLLPAKSGANAASMNAKGNLGSGVAKESKAGEGGGSQESDSFYKMYNKEIKVN